VYYHDRHASPGHLGGYGYGQVRIANVGSLAADGMRFERAYTSVSFTLPSDGERIQVYELISDAMADSQHGHDEPSVEMLN
jgi:hypothetical protein